MTNYPRQMEVPLAQPTPRESREFLHTTTAGVKVPLLQSLTLGGMVMFFMFAVGLAFGWMDPEKPALVMGGMTTLGWLVWALWRWSNLTRPEPAHVQVRSVDHDDDESTPKIVRVQIDKVEDGGQIKQWKMFDLPATESQMAELAVGLLEHNRPFSEREWTGAGRPFSVNEFRTLRSELIKRGLLALKNEKDPRQGYGFTDDGKAVFEQFLA